MFDPSTRVLVIDDMLTMRKIVGKACKSIGLTDIIEAKDGRDGWEKLTTSDKEVGLIVSDWNMPNCTGIELLKRVRADGKYGALPFILVTAEKEGSQVKEAILAGVSNYIVKPFDVDTFKVKVEEVYKKVTQS
ncbi:MAG: hypothetical protein CL678_16955 [Bdellovibrionaceae bacterium]|nr:hypothetical protein [Pseudobdellovibrionaceae bacterium]